MRFIVRIWRLRQWGGRVDVQGTLSIPSEPRPMRRTIARPRRSRHTRAPEPCPYEVTVEVRSSEVGIDWPTVVVVVAVYGGWACLTLGHGRLPSAAVLTV